MIGVELGETLLGGQTLLTRRHCAHSYNLTTDTAVQVSMCSIIPIFMEIDQTIAEIWSFFDVLRWLRPVILSFFKFETLTADTVRRV